MNARLVALGVAVAGVILAQKLGAGPATSLRRALPVSNQDIVVDRLLVADRPDGCTWIVWRQWRQPTWDVPRGLAPDDGVYCRLVTGDGRDVLPARRIFVLDTIPPTEPGTNMTIGPTPRYLAATSDGGALVVMASGLGHTQLTSIASGGSVRSQRTDVTLAGLNPDVRGYAISSRHAVWFSESPAGSRLTFADRGYAGSAIAGHRLRRFGLTVGKGKLSLTEIASYAGRTRQTDWAWSSPTTSALMDWGRDTIVVVFVPEAGSYDRAFGGIAPGDILKVLWLRGADGSLLDSTSVPCSAVAGGDFVGPLIPRAVLARTKTGHAFAVATPTGVSTYELDRRCRPVRGPRERAVALPPERYAGRGFESVFCALRTTTGSPSIYLWSTCWFALGENGDFYYEWAPADSSADRPR